VFIEVHIYMEVL